MQSQFQVFLLPVNFASDRMKSINTAWLPSTDQNCSLQSRFFWDEFPQESRHFRGWNFGERKKTECLLAIGEDRKVSFLEWPWNLCLHGSLIFSYVCSECRLLQANIHAHTQTAIVRYKHDMTPYLILKLQTQPAEWTQGYQEEHEQALVAV